MKEPWVGVEEVAAHLGVGKDSVYRWVESKGLPARRVGRLLRFRLGEVDGWVETRGGPRESPREPGAIREMVRRIVEGFHPDRIVLFGSHARGDAGPDSDVDLLVVMPVEGSKREKQIEIRLALHDIPVPKDIVVITPEELERKRRVPGTVVRPALQDGEVLYIRRR